MIRGYKGFDKNLRCRDFQYEIGKSYETKETPQVSYRGFHLCEFPLDTFGYYPPANSRYCEVEGDGDCDEDGNDTMVAVSKLRVGAEIGIKGIIEAGVKFILDKVDWENAKETNAGDWSMAGNAGDRSMATNTGDWSAATNAGDRSMAANTGNRSVATNTGHQSVAANAGHWSVATNAGDRSMAANTGDWSAATNTGDRSVATNTGDRSVATNTGDWSAATNTGNGSTAVNKGYRSAATNTGDWSMVANTGYQSAAINTGHQSVASVEGKESVAMAIGRKGQAKGALGCWLVLAEWSQDDNGNYHIINVKCAKVDGIHLKPDTYYRLKNGEFVEADFYQMLTE